MQGSMSRNFDLGPSFHFMKCRKKDFENILKIYQKFFYIKSKLRPKSKFGDTLSSVGML